MNSYVVEQLSYVVDLTVAKALPVNGASAVVYLNGATVALTGSSDTANFYAIDMLTLAGGSDTLAFQHGIGGKDVVGGSVSSDVIQMSKLDFGSFSLLRSSGEL